MAARIVFLIFALSWGFADNAVAQLELDLSKQKAGASTTEQLPTGAAYTAVVLNKLPNKRYTYTLSIVVVDQPIPAITLPQFQGTVPTPTGKKSFAGEEECSDSAAKALKTALTGLDEATTESAVPDAAKAAEPILRDNGKFGKCDGFTVLKDLVDHTQATELVPEVKSGQDVILTVRRTGPTPAAEILTWTKTFQGRPRGEWATTYGFSFIGDWFSSNESFTSEETSDQGKFVVSKDSTQDHLKFVPSLFFTWQPARPNVSRNLAVVFSGGLGFDLSNPIVFLAPSLSWNRNLTLHVGLAAAKVDRLLGRYQPGDTVGTNLTPDQLKQSVYRINPFVSLSFNFSSNPFANGAAAETKNASEKKAAEEGKVGK